MQEVKYKLAMFNSLRCANLAATDLKLLAKRCPQHPDMARFMFSPERNADDILFSLLDHATEDEILENRTENEQGKIDENGGDGHNQTEGEGGTPLNGADGHNQTEGEGGAPPNGGDGHNQTEGEGGTPLNGADGHNQTEGEGGAPPNGDDDHTQTEGEGGTPANGDDGHIQTEGEDEQTADGNNDETSEGQSSKFENETEGEGDEEDMPTETDGKQPATATCVENGSEQTDEHQAVPQDKVPKAKDAKKK